MSRIDSWCPTQVTYSLGPSPASSPPSLSPTVPAAPSGGKACLPTSTRCGMAQHRERFAAIDRPLAFCECGFGTDGSVLLPGPPCEGRMHDQGQESSSRKLVRVEGLSVGGWGCSECAWVFNLPGWPIGKTLGTLRISMFLTVQV